MAIAAEAPLRLEPSENEWYTPPEMTDVHLALTVITNPLSNVLLVIPVVLASTTVLVLLGYWLSRDRD